MFCWLTLVSLESLDMCDDGETVGFSPRLRTSGKTTIKTHACLAEQRRPPHIACSSIGKIIHIAHKHAIR